MEKQKQYKFDLSNILCDTLQEQRVLGKDKTISRYHENHNNTLRKNSTKFRLVKGQFTGFIHNQHKNQILGPLEGQERTLDRARETKRRIFQQSITSLQRLKSNPSVLSTARESSLWRTKQKRNIRKSRQLLHNSMKVQQQSRRFRHSPQFLLPKVLAKKSLEKKQSKYYIDGFYTIDCGSMEKLGLDPYHQ